MKRIFTFTAAVLVSFSLAGFASGKESSQLDSEIAALDVQIDEVEATIASYESGMIGALAESRREALLLLRTLIESRQQAETSGATIEVTIPAVEPDSERANQLLGELAAQQQQIEAAEQEAATAGGLIRALALSRVETEKLTLAQLQMAYLQARYGIAFPIPPELSSSATSLVPAESKTPARVAYVDEELADTPLPWADPDHPDVDYSLTPFALANDKGDRISGWWAIKEERAPIDDSPGIFAVNYSAYDGSSVRSPTVLSARCREGETSFYFLQDNYLRSELRRNSFDITYRIDDRPAQSARWSELTGSKGAGLFGSSAESFLRELYDAEGIFIRLTERNGQQHDVKFELAGVKNMIEAVAGACGWSTLDLSKDDYRAIQAMLNAGGFDAGAPDGVWGSGSRKAMRAFQEQKGLPETGVPDHGTLEALGVEEND